MELEQTCGRNEVGKSRNPLAIRRVRRRGTGNAVWCHSHRGFESRSLRLFCEFGDFRLTTAIFWFKRVGLICTRRPIGFRNLLLERCLRGSNPVDTFVRQIWFESVSGRFWTQLDPIFSEIVAVRNRPDSGRLPPACEAQGDRYRTDKPSGVRFPSLRGCFPASLWPG